MSRPRRLLVLYWHPSSPDTLRNAIRKHLAALENGTSAHEILYYNVFTGLPPEWLKTAGFDAVIFHTLALTQRWQGLFGFRKIQYRWIADLDCVKIAIPQDEYDHNEVLDEFLYEMGVDVIFTNFDASHRAVLYPIMHRRAEFVECLTGYVDEDLLSRYRHRVRPIEERPIDIVYRAAHLPYWFGSQGQLKHRIADIVRRAAVAQGLRCNISTRLEDTITGHQWLDFLASSRAVIGCESGSTCLDRRGEMKSRITRLLAEKPDLTFEEADRLLPPGWDDHRFLAVSPRHFEAVMTRTCQVLVKGRYDGILIPEKHYISVEPDFSNLHEVLERLRDARDLQEMVDRAYDDIIDSGRYTHKGLAIQLEAAIDRLCKPRGSVSHVVSSLLWPLLCHRAGPQATRTMRLPEDAKAAAPPEEIPLYGPLEVTET